MWIHLCLTKVHLFGCLLQPTTLLLYRAWPIMFGSLEARSLDKARVNEDICFHSGSAGTCPPLPRLSETISRHLLGADCSGRFLLLLSPSTPPSVLGKVLHRSTFCVAGTLARSDSEQEKKDTDRKQTLRRVCAAPPFVCLCFLKYGLYVAHLFLAPYGNKRCHSEETTTYSFTAQVYSVCLQNSQKSFSAECDLNACFRESEILPMSSCVAFENPRKLRCALNSDSFNFPVDLLF